MTRLEQLQNSIKKGHWDDIEWIIECTNAPIGWEHVQLAIEHHQPQVAEQLKNYISANDQ